MENAHVELTVHCLLEKDKANEKVASACASPAAMNSSSDVENDTTKLASVSLMNLSSVVNNTTEIETSSQREGHGMVSSRREGFTMDECALENDTPEVQRLRKSFCQFFSINSTLSDFKTYGVNGNTVADTHVINNCDIASRNRFIKRHNKLRMIPDVILHELLSLHYLIHEVGKKNQEFHNRVLVILLEFVKDDYTRFARLARILVEIILYAEGDVIP